MSVTGLFIEKITVNETAVIVTAVNKIEEAAHVSHRSSYLNHTFDEVKVKLEDVKVNIMDGTTFMSWMHELINSHVTNCTVLSSCLLVFI